MANEECYERLLQQLLRFELVDYEGLGKKFEDDRRVLTAERSITQSEL
jgi:hypothetical protein